MSQQINHSPSVVLIQPRDPLVLRDARPFLATPGARAFSLPWPMPRTVAGTVRSFIGNAAGYDWSTKKDALKARQMVCHGPLMTVQPNIGGPWEIHVPAPRDVIFYRSEPGSNQMKAMVLRPQALQQGEGCDLPAPASEAQGGYERALANTSLRPLSVTEDVKPETGVPPWWSLRDAMTWLNATDLSAPERYLPLRDTGGSAPSSAVTGARELAKDVRMHVSIDAGSGRNVTGALFATEGRVFPDIPGPTGPAVGMVCRTSASGFGDDADAFVPLGGERRLSRISVDAPGVSWPASDRWYPTEEDVTRASGLRLLIVTPAIFTHGWLPGWMADGTIPGMGGLKVGLRLVGAAVGRQMPVSGWRLSSRSGQKPGPRATQYAVPAGSVYFFEFSKGKPTPDQIRAIWDALWLAPVSDRAIDRDEGFGLVLPGLWSNDSMEGNPK